MSIFLYGATGYTGALIAEQCAARGVDVILGGRREAPLRALAERLGLRFKLAALDDAAALDGALADARCVLNCAGPFSRTAAPMVDACLRTGRAYLDITGEITVFEALRARSKEARERGVLLLPGVGFDVVPSDCLAAHVHRRLPSATRLRLAIGMFGSLSHGTAATMIEHMHGGGAVRKNGRIVPEAAAARRRSFDLGKGPRTAVSMPWGDVATAWYSTRIPDIEVYFVLPRRMLLAARAMPLLALLMRSARLKSWVQARIPEGGPSAAAREQGMSVLLAEAEDDAGQVVRSRLNTLEGYALTVETALLCAQRVIAGVALTGFHTPSTAFGPDLVLDVPRTTRVDLTS